MQFKVPQDVQREDTILWFITLRQLIFVLIGGGISYALYVGLSKIYELNGIELFAILIPFLVALAFAFLRIRGMSLMMFILVCAEQFIFRPGRRYWSQEGNILISMTTRISSNKKKDVKADNKSMMEREKLKNLAQMLDGEKAKQKSLTSS
ncbi:MAG TPA: PrgI family protein [Candidatus Gracilibacteria bacterium]